MMNVNREKLMKQIQAYSFAAHDAMLYLDSHPTSKCALDYYNKHKALAMKATREYEARFGPLTLPFDACSWEWTKGPWPWQNECNYKE
ncbi:MAG: spore coat protein CotJB [Clostridia bacterium]|nr:spore coat protein CotJB [Clostridia bacterium]